MSGPYIFLQNRMHFVMPQVNVAYTYWTSIVVGKSAELESLVQLAGVLAAVVNGPFTVGRLCHFKA